ncbi:MAG: hypothetical protein AAB558_04310 [Patescibacteria group bacterium]
MGSFIELNDTLQLTPEQGFPAELSLEQHLKTPFELDQFSGKNFHFQGKSGIRIFHAPPVRNFLVENRNGKWIYWGLVHITQVVHDYVKQKTSGQFFLIYLNSPDEMKVAHDLIDGREDKKFFTSLEQKI